MAGTGVRIVLARHAETISNVEGRWQGQDDSPLTERGERQADRLAEALADEAIAAVYSSDLGRAMETARRVAARHRLPVLADPRLREVDTGAWTGRLGSELRGEAPAEMEAWLHRPSSLRLPGGETLAEVQARSLPFFADRLGDHAGQTVVVITHGTVGQAIVVEAMGRPLADLWLEQRFDNCQITRLAWQPEARNGWAAGLRLVELCDVRHLEEIGTLKGWRVADQEAGRGGA